MVTEDPFDATRIARRTPAQMDDATQVAAPRVPASKPIPEVDRVDEPAVELPREHYGIRPVPVQVPAAEPPSREAAAIPVLDVEGAAARVRRARLWGVIGLVATMVAVVVLAGIGLAVLL